MALEMLLGGYAIAWVWLGRHTAAGVEVAEAMCREIWARGRHFRGFWRVEGEEGRKRPKKIVGEEGFIAA